MTAPLAALLALGMQAAAPSAAGEVGLLLTRRVDLARLPANEIMQGIASALTRGQVGLAMEPAAAEKALKAAGVPETEACGGKKDCVLELGRKLGAGIVVGVQVGSVGAGTGPVAVRIDAWRVADGADLVDHDAVILQRTALRTVQGIADFARRLREAAASAPKVAEVDPGRPPEPPPVDPRPDDPKVEPPPPPPIVRVTTARPDDPTRAPPEAVTGPAATEKGHTAGYAMVGVAGAAAAVAVGCLVSGLVLYGQLQPDASTNRVNMTYDKANAQLGTVNGLLTASLIGGIAAGAAGGTAILVW